MLPGRSLRLLILALAVFLGLAAGMDRSPPAGQPQTVSTISAPRESLPVPVHDEATCAFCQAATFPPCTPQPTDISVAERGEVRRERPAPDVRVPRTTANRPASSRAPPPLRFV
jgi:hypothetical protein